MSESRNLSDVQLAPSSDAATWTSGFHPAAHKTSAAPAMTPAMATPIPTMPPRSCPKPVLTAALLGFVACKRAFVLLMLAEAEMEEVLATVELSFDAVETIVDG